MAKYKDPEYHKKYYKANRDKILARSLAIDPEAKKEYDKAYYARPIVKARRDKQTANWVAKNVKGRQQIIKRHYETHKNLIFSYAAARRARLHNAMPKWLTEEQKSEIKRIYDQRPEGYHVDHIVPLKGKDVNGLHVPWNLQYLPAHVNLSKGAKHV